jgi:hypothetical protein
VGEKKSSSEPEEISGVVIIYGSDNSVERSGGSGTGG